MLVGLESKEEKEETKEGNKEEGHGGADTPETTDSIVWRLT